MNLRSSGHPSDTSPKPPGAVPRHAGATGESSDFETFVRKGIADIRSMLSGLEASIEFQANRTTDLEARVNPLEKKVKDMETQIQDHARLLARATAAENKLERFSRKNNFRIVGIPQRPKEDCMALAREFLIEHFQFDSPKIERAHRDGPQKGNLPRHLLVKMLSFQDKRSVLTQQRKKLEETNFYIIDDLTKTDREEKKRWQKEVQAAYQTGKRYHFSGGKWRDSNGALAPFYSA